MQSMRQCVNTTQLGAWLLRDVLIGDMAEIIVSQVCVNHKSKSDGNLITKYPCRYILAPGQAHDADNQSVGSLIH